MAYRYMGVHTVTIITVHVVHVTFTFILYNIFKPVGRSTIWENISSFIRQRYESNLSIRCVIIRVSHSQGNRTWFCSRQWSTVTSVCLTQSLPTIHNKVVGKKRLNTFLFSNCRYRMFKFVKSIFSSSPLA